jgi:hypothetical protein
VALCGFLGHFNSCDWELKLMPCFVHLSYFPSLYHSQDTYSTAPSESIPFKKYSKTCILSATRT